MTEKPEPKTSYHHIGILGGRIDDVTPANIQVLQNNVLSTLDKHYPAFKGSWSVEVDVRGGILQIRNLALSGKMGFIMKISAVDPAGRTVMRHAGELLERYRVSREKALDIREQVYGIPKDFRGQNIHIED